MRHVFRPPFLRAALRTRQRRWIDPPSPKGSGTFTDLGVDALPGARFSFSPKDPASPDTGPKVGTLASMGVGR